MVRANGPRGKAARWRVDMRTEAVTTRITARIRIRRRRGRQRKSREYWRRIVEYQILATEMGFTHCSGGEAKDYCLVHIWPAAK